MSKEPPQSNILSVRKWFWSHGLPWNTDIESKLTNKGVECVEDLKKLNSKEWDEYFKEELIVTQQLSKYVFQKLNGVLKKRAEEEAKAATKRKAMGTKCCDDDDDDDPEKECASRSQLLGILNTNVKEAQVLGDATYADATPASNNNVPKEAQQNKTKSSTTVGKRQQWLLGILNTSAKEATDVTKEAQQNKITKTTTSVGEKQHQQGGSENQNSRPKKRPRCDIRTDAGKILAPRFNPGTKHIEDMKWDVDTTFKAVGSSTTTGDVKDLQAIIFAISRGNPDRAGKAISRFLGDKSNVQLKTTVLEDLGEEDEVVTTNNLVLDGIKDSIAHHTKGIGGTRMAAAETFIKNVVAACLFRIVKDKAKVSNSAMRSMIGTSWNQVKLARVQVQNLLNNNAIIAPLKRNIRKDCIRKKLEPYVFDFLQRDEYTTLNNRKKGGLVALLDPRTGEEVTVHRRIWRYVKKTEQHVLFLSSDQFKQFQHDHNRATVGYEVWMKVLAKVGTFVSTPSLPEPSVIYEKTSDGTQGQHYADNGGEGCNQLE